MVLQIEHIFERAIKTIGPQMCSGLGIDKLTRDTNAISELPNAAFKYIAHTELAADLLHVHGPALVGKTRITRDDKQPTKERQSHRDIFTTPSAKYSCSGSA